MIIRFFPSVIFLVLFSYCAKEQKNEQPKGKLQGLHKYYFPDGKLYLEINYKDSVPHGTTKRYFKSGQLLEQSEYRNGIQHGITKTYYEDGKLSSETPYDSGRVNGVKKKYRKDGSLAYEAPYYFDKPCTGLKEYFLSGKKVDNYPEIVIKPQNDLMTSGSYTLLISLSDKSKSVQFFEGALEDGKYIPNGGIAIATSNGVAKLYYFLPPGGFKMQKINIIAKTKTDLGNYYIATKSYNLAIENR